MSVWWRCAISGTSTTAMKSGRRAPSKKRPMFLVRNSAAFRKQLPIFLIFFIRQFSVL
jgi:hypothetical protein